MCYFFSIEAKLPPSKDVDPLLEIDRSPRKLELFLSNHNPPLNIGDLKRFLPCTINVDPYHQKCIRGNYLWGIKRGSFILVYRISLNLFSHLFHAYLFLELKTRSDMNPDLLYMQTPSVPVFTSNHQDATVAHDANRRYKVTEGSY